MKSGGGDACHVSRSTCDLRHASAFAATAVAVHVVSTARPSGAIRGRCARRRSATVAAATPGASTGTAPHAVSLAVAVVTVAAGTFRIATGAVTNTAPITHARHSRRRLTHA